MTTEPLASVITPTFNPGWRLKRCLESVAAQTYPNVEHLVIDAGSTDGTIELLKEHPNVRWISEPDDGQSNALNKGFRMAQGELLTWINGDDTLEPNAVASIVATWKRTGADLIYGNCLMWEGERSHTWDPPATIDMTSFDWVCPIAQQGTFFTKSAYEKVGGIDESYDLSMDYDLWLRLLESGVRTAFVNEVLGTFEVHDESKTGSRGNHEFAREGAIALRRRGRSAASDLMLGRAAAMRATSGPAHDRRVSSARLRTELEDLIGSSPEFKDVERARALSGAYAEAMDIEVRLRKPLAHIAGLRHLLHLPPWRSPLARATVKRDVRVVVARAVRRFKKP